MTINSNPNLPYGNRTVPAGDLLLSGNLDASGGSGALGGSGGPIAVPLDTSRQPNGQEIVLLGYASLDSSGGASSSGLGIGGNAGAIDVFNNVSTCGGNRCSSGSTVNYADINARGGSGGTVANGGQGGSITLETQSSYYFNTVSFENVINAGNLDTSGGAGVVGGSGGPIVLYGRNNATNSGTLKANGGAGSAGNGGAGADSNGCRACGLATNINQSGIAIYAGDAAVTNTGGIDVSGGASAGARFVGGAGGIALLNGRGVSNSATLLAAGGNADAASGVAGNGGLVQLYSMTSPSVNTAAAPAGINVKAGTAFTPGVPGVVEFDGRFVTGGWAH